MKKILTIFIGLLFVLSTIFGASALQDNSILMGARFTDSNNLGIENANVTVTFYNDAGKVSTAYNETFYNSTDSNGYFNNTNLVSSSDVNITYGKSYYMDIVIDGTNFNFSTGDLLPFKAWWGKKIDVLQINSTIGYFNQIGAFMMMGDITGNSQSISGVEQVKANIVNASYIYGDLSNATGISAGDSWSDAVDSDIIPDGNFARNLGSEANSFKFGYLNTMYIENLIGFEGDSDTYIIHSANQLSLYAGSRLNLYLQQSEVSINEQSYDVDFRVESNGDANNIFSNAGTNKVGIGTNTPDEKLEVNGNIKTSGYINSTVSSGTAIDFGNGCAWKVNSTDVYLEC